jgi:hypothetical protein
VNPTDADRPVFDASAVLALMQGEPGADKLRELQPSAVVNAVNAAEVLAKLVNRGVPATEAQAAYDALHLETSCTWRRRRSNRRWLRSRPATCIRVCPWETGASWRRPIGTDPVGLRIANSEICSEAWFRI